MEGLVENADFLLEAEHATACCRFDRTAAAFIAQLMPLFASFLARFCGATLRAFEVTQTQLDRVMRHPLLADIFLVINQSLRLHLAHARTLTNRTSLCAIVVRFLTLHCTHPTARRINRHIAVRFNGNDSVTARRSKKQNQQRGGCKTHG